MQPPKKTILDKIMGLPCDLKEIEASSKKNEEIVDHLVRTIESKPKFDISPKT